MLMSGFSSTGTCSRAGFAPNCLCFFCERFQVNNIIKSSLIACRGISLFLPALAAVFSYYFVHMWDLCYVDRHVNLCKCRSCVSNKFVPFFMGI